MTRSAVVTPIQRTLWPATIADPLEGMFSRPSKALLLKKAIAKLENLIPLNKYLKKLFPQPSIFLPLAL
jgi:hypothetical protein